MENMNLKKVAQHLKGLSGCFLVGKVDGVDFTPSGKLENGTVYGSSIKIKFTQTLTVVKNVNGLDLPTTKLTSNIIKIPVQDNELASKVAEYNSMLNKDVVIELDLPDNSSYKTNAVLLLD